MNRRFRNDLHPVVWVVSNEPWPRACLRAELIERGYDAIGFEAISTAHAALNLPAALRPSVSVVDLAGQPDDYRRFRAFVQDAGRVIALASATHAQSPEMQALPWTAVLLRPVSLGAVADAVDAVLRPPPHIIAPPPAG